jgi:hypothetical protein
MRDALAATSDFVKTCLPGDVVEFLDSSSIPQYARFVSFDSSTLRLHLVTANNDNITAQISDTTMVYSSEDLPPDFQLPADGLPVPRRADLSLEKLWRQRRQRTGGKSGRGEMLSKKEIRALPENVQDVIRAAQKRGSHIVDAIEASGYVHNLDIDDDSNSEILPRAAVSAARLLHGDRTRFKRVACFPLLDGKFRKKGDDPASLTVLTGGYSAVDYAMRATLEASRFAQAPEVAAAITSPRNASSSVTASSSATSSSRAYKSVLRDLESLAMGGRSPSLAAREALKKLDLNVTAAGAKEVLVSTDSWSPHVHFSNATLAAAKRFAEAWKLRPTGVRSDGRTDLSGLPTYAIDTERTAFRDDAISLGRSSGGETELVIHVADASSVFAFDELRRAAKERVSSRYDNDGHGLGVFHLLPVPVLEAVAISPTQPSSSCVSLFVRIDELTGSVVKCKVERTVIDKPVVLTFEQAETLMDKDESLAKIERLLAKWHDSHKRSSDAAMERGEKMSERARNDSLFNWARAQRLVNAALELYSKEVTQMMAHARQPLPLVGKNGRAATAVLRRYVDMLAQVQLVRVLCDRGGGGPAPLSREEIFVETDEVGRARSQIRRSK